MKHDGGQPRYELLVALTQQRDPESLHDTLLQSFQQLLPQHRLALYGVQEGIDATKLMPLAWHPDDATPPSPKDLVGHCPKISEGQQLGVAMQQLPSGAIRTLISLSGGRGTQVLLVLDGGEITQAWPVIEACASVYANQYDLLHYSRRDALTGLLNRQGFDGLMEKLLNQHHAPKRRADDQGGWCFALLDIDHFKQINDRFGHLYGDEVLLRLAQLMRESFREDDLLFRYGGEEFAAALRHLSKDMAGQVLERFRQKIEEFPFPQIGRVTVSIGYTYVITPRPLVVLTSDADKALYYAKDNGRNQVRCYEHLVQSGLLAMPEEHKDAELF